LGHAQLGAKRQQALLEKAEILPETVFTPYPAGEAQNPLTANGIGMN
jgi:hypothetical protein